MSVSKLAAFEAGEDFDIDTEFDMYSLHSKADALAVSSDF